MDRQTFHPMCARFSSFSWRVAPKPLTYIEGQGPSVPKACLPRISRKIFNLPHDTYDSNENGSWNVRGCTQIRNSSQSAKSHSDRGEELESSSEPVCGPSPPECIEALENGCTDLGEILSRSASCIPFFAFEGEFVQGIRKLQKLVSIHPDGMHKKLFTSCLTANSRLEDLETETEILPSPPDPFFNPVGEPVACGLEMHGNTAARLYPDWSKGLGLPGCLRLETQFQSDTTIDLECYLPSDAYLPPMELEDVVKGMKTLVLNLNGTLVHPSLEPTDECDFSIPVWVNGRLCEVFVVKRPGLDNFLQTVARMYEVVVFTPCSRQYTDLVLDILDRKTNCIRHRLYENVCILTEKGWRKNLSELGRDLRKVITVDSRPNSHSLQPANLLQVGRYTGDKTDRELDDLLLELGLVWRLNV